MSPAPTTEELVSAMATIKRMLLAGAVFVAVGYLLIGMALFFELTQFAPLVEEYFIVSKAVRDAAPTGSVLTQQLATINQWPSLLLWLKLGGIGHILTGVFIALAGILRALTLMPDRLGSLMMAQEKAMSADAAPADD
jgi:hypothetical protein